MYVNCGTHCTHDHPWNKGSPTLRFFPRFLPRLREFFLARVGAWVGWGVMNIWPVKPFETVIVIKGYTNKM